MKIRENKFFYKTMLAIAVPIALQNLIASGVNALDTLMISTLKEAAVSGVGFANKIFFFFALICFGINTGSATFLSQYWGKRDMPSIRKVIGLCMTLCATVGILFTAVGFCFPKQLIGLFSDDPEVILLGGNYLRAVLPTYLLSAVNFAIAIGFRTTGSPKTPLYASLVSFFVNVIGNYLLIFGKFGFPQLGIVGAGYSTSLARLCEFAVLFYASKRYDGPMNTRFRNFFRIDRAFVANYLKVTAPVIVNETCWSLGQVLYVKAYALLGTDAAASIQITFTMVDLFLVFSRGLANAATIMIGNEIGREEPKRAYDYGVRFLKVNALFGAATGVLLALGSGAVVSIFTGLQPSVRETAKILLIFTGLTFFLRTLNSTLVVGLLRGGGDTKFCMCLETGTTWLIGVPLAFLGASVLNFPILLVYALVSMDEFAKACIGLLRIRSKKWIRNVT